MNDPGSGEPETDGPPNVLAAAAVAIVVCLAMIGLFVWQPWSPGPPAVHSGSIDGR